jgi:hypothetical protein
MARFDTDLVARLRRTRLGYEDEQKLHTFWVASYTGGGGFRNGQVPTMAAPLWGRQTYDFSWMAQSAQTVPPLLSGPAIQTWSYLVPFRNEDSLSYNDRVNSSIYPNLIEPIVDVTNSFLTAEDAVRENLPKLLELFVADVDGSGRKMASLMAESLLRIQLVGKVHALVDPPSWTGTSMAESIKLGLGPRVRLLWPQDILDMDEDGNGKISAIKFVTYHELPRKSMLDDKRVVERITIYTRTNWQRFDLITDRGQTTVVDLPPAEREGPNRLGVVPMATAFWRQPVNDGRSNRGQPQIGTLAQLARALYNRVSEHDFNLRQTTFAQLVVPGGDENNQETVEAGPGNALVEDENTKNITRYISPDGAIAAAYEKRIAQLVLDIYRTALIDKNDAAHPETSASRAMRFAQTNNVLAAVAGNLDAFELELLNLAAAYYRIPASELDRIVVRRRTQYQVSDLEASVDTALKAKELPFGPRGHSNLTKRIYRTLVPNLSPTEYEAVDKEITAACEAEASAKQQPVSAPTPAPHPPGDPESAGTPSAQDENDAGSQVVNTTSRRATTA